MKKNVAIVFGITKNYTFALANVLIAMKKHCKPCWDDIIVYHDGVSQKEQDAINSICPCKFILFDESMFNDDAIHAEGLKNYSLLTLARFECFGLLNDYKTVIWHDVDILVQKDFSGLLGYGKKSGYAATQSPTFRVEQNFFGIMPGYDMMSLLYNAGILVMHDHLPDYADMRIYCYNMFNEHAQKLRYNDQAVLNMMIQDYHLEVDLIDLDHYCCHPATKGYENASIIHAYGSDKFWNSKRLAKQFPEWHENDREWKKIASGFRKKEQDSDPEITVLMSIYERTDFVYDAVQSILSQTFTDFEFVIVVEFSPYQDQLCEVLENFQDDRIVIIRNQEKLGFPASLNVGLEAARGKYIARMDDDDISMPDRFEKQLSFLQANPDVSVVGSWIQFFGRQSNVEKRPASYEELRAWAIKECPMFHPTVMIRKADMDNNDFRYDPEWLTEDYDLWMRMIHRLKFANIPEILHNFRASGQNATVTKATRVLNCHLDLMRRNLKEQLGLEFSRDEMYLLRWPHLINECFNSEDMQKMRNDVLIRIYAANAEKKVFDQALLEQYLGEVKRNRRAEIKTALRKYPYLYEKLRRAYRWLLRKDVEQTVESRNGSGRVSLLTRIKMRLMPPSSRSFHNWMALLEEQFKHQQENNDNLVEQIRMLDERIQRLDGAIHGLGQEDRDTIGK